ncbi:hypothetical protein GCM10011348_16000 [Marinobacterium nitratireducens]|uniref:Uncharacterized protein n=1 Tax=Marinobacterium nitratireducens TaxID=518897 RepID=A0A917ZBC0_9GAMM|nr:hypothetical protein GCM10011348_16000 [Marinobacterium nitratireducens]
MESRVRCKVDSGYGLEEGLYLPRLIKRAKEVPTPEAGTVIPLLLFSNPFLDIPMRPTRPRVDPNGRGEGSTSYLLVDPGSFKTDQILNLLEIQKLVGHKIVTSLTG